MSFKKGIIRISSELYEKEYKTLAQLFSFFKISFVEPRLYNDSDWVFYGKSELFQEVGEVDKVPEYSATFIKEEGNDDYKFSHFRKIRL
jgi:hypothetical protein